MSVPLSSSQVKHPDNVIGWKGDLRGLAIAISNLRYDKLADFLFYLSSAIYADSYMDAIGKRPQLSHNLMLLRDQLLASRDLVNRIWKVCDKHMPEVKKDE